MKRRSSSQLTGKQFLPWTSLVCSVLLYALHFFVGGGRSKLINDSRAYLTMTDGASAGTPYDSRVFGPFIASIIAFLSGISSHSAFQILTVASFIGGLLLIRKIIADQRGSFEWQAAVVLALGCALAATFGYTPVMVDPLLFVLSCLTVIALDRNYWWSVLVLSVLAALTKEYGLLLGLAGSVVAWRRNNRKFAILLTVLPCVVLLVAMVVGSDSKRPVLDTWNGFINAMFGYHKYLFEFRGAVQYFEILYMWAWSVLWPVLVIAAGLVFSRFGRHEKRTHHEIGFAFMLVAIPILLVGDWGRALLIIVPFACAVATSHPLARNASFAALLALGGLSTALARPFHSEYGVPRIFTLVMIAISIASTVLIGLKTVRFAASSTTPQLDPGLETPAPAVADR